MKKISFFARLLALAVLLGLAVTPLQAQDSKTIPPPAQTQVAAQFDGHALYKAVFEQLRDKHIMLQDPAVRAKWVAEWEHKHDTDGTLDKEDSADKVTLEMIRSLGQRFDYYLLPEDTKDEAQRNDPSLVGIGAQLNIEGANKAAEPIIKALPKDATRAQKIEAAKAARKAVEAVAASDEHPIVVVAPMEGGPAEKAGLQPKDRITKVNGTPVNGKTLQEVVDTIRGKEGVEVKVTIERTDSTGKASEQTLTIKRGKVVSHVAHYKDLGNGLSYIKLDDFSSRFAAKEMHDALVKAAAGNAVIIDLRGNPGGRLDLVEVIAAFFIKDGTVIEQHTRNGDDMITERMVLQPDFVMTTEMTNGDAKTGKLTTDDRPPVMLPDNMPVVVLVDEWSASASEILSGTLQANHRAIIVGQPTLGKGVGQNVVQLPSGRSIHVTSFEFLPGGKPMDWIGIVPDIEVKQPELDTTPGAAAPVDAQLEAAKKAATDLVAKQEALSKERQDLKKKHEDDFNKSKNDPNN